MSKREPEWASPMSKKGTKESLQDVLGGGSSIDSTNPLPVVLPEACPIPVTTGLIERGYIFNTAIEADIFLFVPWIANTSDTPKTFRIYACFADAGVLTVMRRRDVAMVTEDLNGGMNLTAYASYTFDIILGSEDLITIQFGADTMALTLLVVEVS